MHDYDISNLVGILCICNMLCELENRCLKVFSRNTCGRSSLLLSAWHVAPAILMQLGP